MSTHVGVGFSERASSLEAGREAAGIALEKAGIKEGELAILFSTSKHDPTQIRDGVRSVLGPKTRLIGGYGTGVITDEKFGYDGYQMGLAVLSSDTIQFDTFIETGLADNEYNVGLALGKQIKDAEFRGTPNTFLMYDFIKEKSRTEGIIWNINWATPLLAGMKKSLGTWPPMAGIAMIGDWQGNTGYQWFDDRIIRHSAMSLVLSGDVQMDTLIMHGCKPLSDYRTITKADKNVVIEIDNKPALGVIAELLGQDRFKEWLDLPWFVIFGVNRGDKFGEFREDNYTCRLITGVDKKRKGLIMFEPDLTEGTEIQLMQRNISDFEYVRTRCTEILNRINNRKPIFTLYIDCAGRCSAYSGTEGEEAEVVQEIIGSKMPLLGAYSGTEIAMVGDMIQPCVFTGILCVFSE
jgi:hypothetical protein